MNFNSVKVYFNLIREQKAERKKVMNFVRRIKKEQKYKQRMRKNSSLVSLSL